MFPIRDHNPSERTPYVCYALIAINVVVFLAYWLTIPTERGLANFFYTWGVVPEFVMGGHQFHTILTSMFLHGGWLHIIGNMLFLWVFGDNMEDEMGHLPFLGFYLASGVAAAGLQIAADPYSQIPMVGASGAIAGVLGGYILMFPKARVDVMFIIVIIIRIIPIRAWIVLGIWFGLQVVNGAITSTDGGGVAYWAHAGGFAAGALFALPLWLRRGGTAFWDRTGGAPPHPEAVYAPSSIPRVRRR